MNFLLARACWGNKRQPTARKTTFSWHDTELVAVSDSIWDFSSKYTVSGSFRKKTLRSKTLFWIGAGYEVRINLVCSGQAYQIESYYHNLSFFVLSNSWDSLDERGVRRRKEATQCGAVKVHFVHRISTNPNGMLQVISPELLSSSTKLTDEGKLTDFFNGFDLLLSKLKTRTLITAR